MEKRLQAICRSIQPLNTAMMEQVRQYQNCLTKPAGSLGKLEEISIQLAGIMEEKAPDVSKKAVVVMAGDHGVVQEGVSAFPQEVTQQMVFNFAHGGAAINVLSRQMGAEVRVVDIGVAGDVSAPGVIVKKVKKGTDNFTQGPAMSREEAIRALLAGVEVAEELVAEGYRLLATGEMGIGNTTASSAIVALVTGCSVEHAVGPGTGINQEGIQRKINAIQRGIAINQPNPADPIDILAKLGGLEIGGLAGLILGAAAKRVPIVIDGFISTAAALLAYQLAPESRYYMLGSHSSAEPAHRRCLEYLGLDAIFQLGMRLGEGTGAVLTFPLIEAAVRVVREMATFESAGVSGS